MGQSLSQVYIHITFRTKNNQTRIDKDVSAHLHEYIAGICKALDCPALKIGGVADHIHILCRLSKKVTQAKLVEEIKKSSSRWIKTIGSKYANFYWQDGYGLFSVNPSEIEVVTNYIKNQEEHHRNKTFKEELIAFLKKYGVEYDERYLFDE